MPSAVTGRAGWQRLPAPGTRPAGAVRFARPPVAIAPPVCWPCPPWTGSSLQGAAGRPPTGPPVIGPQSLAMRPAAPWCAAQRPAMPSAVTGRAGWQRLRAPGRRRAAAAPFVHPQAAIAPPVGWPCPPWTGSSPQGAAGRPPVGPPVIGPQSLATWLAASWCAALASA